MPLRLLPCLTVCLLWTAGCQKEAQKSDSTTAKPLTQSALYEQFDPTKLSEKYALKFGVEHAVTHQSGLEFNGDLAKAVQIEGGISNEQFQKVFDSVQNDLLTVAESSSVTVKGKPNTDITGRPAWLIGHYFRNVKSDLVRGSYFTYSQGPIQGAVELLSQAKVENNTPRWRLVVVLHEKKVPAEK